MKYDVDHFINKFEAIPDKRWFVGFYYDYDNDDKTKCCVMGHCGIGIPGSGRSSDEGNALFELFRILELHPPAVNDGNNNNYSENTPKQRILAALRDIKNG